MARESCQGLIFTSTWWNVFLGVFSSILKLQLLKDLNSHMICHNTVIWHQLWDRNITWCCYPQSAMFTHVYTIFRFQTKIRNESPFIRHQHQGAFELESYLRASDPSSEMIRDHPKLWTDVHPPIIVLKLNAWSRRVAKMEQFLVFFWDGFLAAFVRSCRPVAQLCVLGLLGVVVSCTIYSHPHTLSVISVLPNKWKMKVTNKTPNKNEQIITTVSVTGF